MRMTRFIGLIALLFSALCAFAQTDQGTITGRVTDSTGAIISKVGVTVTNLNTGVIYPGATNDLGLYTVLYLPVGRYSVEFKREGFKTYNQEGVTVSISQVVKLDATLGVGSVTQTVTVKENAEFVETQRAALGTDLKSDEIEVLPMTAGVGSNGAGGRNLEDTANRTIPTVENTSSWASVAGSMTASKAIVVDGTDNNYGLQGGSIPPGTEAVQEFEVQTTGTGADTEATGGGVYSYTLKSGTNKFHGSGYGFLGNEALDANTWDNNFKGIKRPRDRYKDWGVSAGGPVRIPKLYDGRNKSFFFASYERYTSSDLRDTQNTNTTPTLAFLQGDFSAILGAPLLDSLGQPILVQDDTGNTVPLRQGMIFDPATQNVFPGNIIPTSRFSPLSNKILSDYSQYKPTNNSLTNNFPSILSSGAFEIVDQFDMKADQEFGEKNHLSFSTTYWSFPNGGPGNGLIIPGSTDGGPLGLGGAATNSEKSFRVIDTQTITPNLLNTFRFAYNNYWGGSLLTADSSWDAQALGFPTVDPYLHNLPQMHFGCANTFEQICEDSIGSAYGGLPNGRYQYHYRDEISWIKGRHTMNFGGEFSLIRSAYAANAGALTYTFSSAEGVPDALYNNSAVSQHLGFGFADFELGVYQAAQQGTGLDLNSGRNVLNFFFSDSIKVTPKLTLNVGTRYDINGRWHVQQGVWTNFSLTAQNASWAPLNGAYEYATTAADSYEVNEYYKGVGPFVGAAYQLGKKLVARGSWGVHFLPLGNNMWGATPYSAQAGYTTQSYTSAAPNAAAFYWDTQPYAGKTYGSTRNPNANLAYPPNWAAGSVSVDPNSLQMAYTQAWSADVQYEITPNTLLDVSYIGNIGRDLHEASNDPLNYPTWSQYQPLLAAGTAGSQIATQADAQTAGVPWYPFLTTTQGGNGVSYPAYAGIAPFPQIASVGGILFSGNPISSSAYNALVVELKKRSSNGLIADLSYSLQKSTGNALNQPGGQSGNMAEGWSTSSQWQDPYNYKNMAGTLEGGLPLHQVKGYLVYALPVGRGKQFLPNVNHALDYLVGGWQLGAMGGVNSGLPIHAVFPSFSYPGWSAVWANKVGSVKNTFKHLDLADPGDPSNVMVSPSAFADPTYGTFGNQSLYSYGFRSWMYQNEDFSMLKNFYFGADNRVKVVLRGEFFDVTNGHHWSDPTTYATNSPNFGAVTGVSGNRHGQVGLRVEW